MWYLLWLGMAMATHYDRDLYDGPEWSVNPAGRPCDDRRAKSDIPAQRWTYNPPAFPPPIPLSYSVPVRRRAAVKPTNLSKNAGQGQCIESPCVTKMLVALGVPADAIKGLGPDACDAVVRKIKPTAAIQAAIQEAVNQANGEALNQKLNALVPPAADGQPGPLEDTVQARLTQITPDEVIKAKAILSAPELDKCSKSTAWCWALIKDVVMNPNRYGADKPGLDQAALEDIAKADLAIDGALKAANQAVGPAHDMQKCIKEFPWCQQRTAQFFASL